MRKLEPVAGVGVCLSDLHAVRLDRLRLEVRTLGSYNKKANRKPSKRGIGYSLDLCAKLTDSESGGFRIAHKRTGRILPQHRSTLFKFLDSEIGSINLMIFLDLP